MFNFVSVAELYLEEMLYGVSEADGIVELCVIVTFPEIECPISFPFNIGISTSNGTAGTA